MRITGGRWRSRALTAPRGMATRPTSDRVREALFSMLASDGLLFDPHAQQEPGPGPAPLEGTSRGLRVLDLYAGSGALAFEALSRGAGAAVLVEQARDAVAAIRQNAKALGASSVVSIFDTKVERALGRIIGPFGLVFLDPPYADVAAPAFAGILRGAAVLVEEAGALVLEHSTADAAPTAFGLVLDRSRRHGDTTLSLYRRAVD